ncbi:uncharacterized protein LOC136086061 [Hydra vulgaris]|uniref:Uncharacterized protein LOC136086061 n=1 Tax=Hydra vulgaris TaxID=6087 RepID=A0ABM4CRA1_HYDVU
MLTLNAKQHDSILNKVLEILKQRGLTLNFEKCLFGKEKVKFFGFIFSKGGMQPDPEKHDNIKNMPLPENTKSLQSFLGLMNYFKRFILHHSTITYPLQKLLNKDSSCNWSFKCQRAFDKLKNIMTSDSCVRYFDLNKESLVGISAMIVQNTPNKQDFKLISYNSKALSSV